MAKAKQFSVTLHFGLSTRVLDDASDVKEVYGWIREQLGKDLSAKQMQLVAFAGKLARGEAVDFYAPGFTIKITRVW